MKKTDNSSDQTSRIIQVVDAIAFQTNILALSAAVEAARAGEDGMAFLAAAEEARNLAQRSAQAARDTAALFKKSVSKSHKGGKKLQPVAGSIG
jgi:methyl-accepting chemotaxis protein